MYIGKECTYLGNLGDVTQILHLYRAAQGSQGK